MYWGEGALYAATSKDLVRWTPVEIDTGPDRYLTWEPAPEARRSPWTIERVPGAAGLHPIAGPRRRRFDSLLVEPGPPAMLTDAGIVLIYNGANHPGVGEADTPGFAYQPGQMLLDAADPTAVVARQSEPFLRIDPVEADGQVGNDAASLQGPGRVSRASGGCTSAWRTPGLGVSTAPMRRAVAT